MVGMLGLEGVDKLLNIAIKSESLIAKYLSKDTKENTEIIKIAKSLQSISFEMLKLENLLDQRKDSLKSTEFNTSRKDFILKFRLVSANLNDFIRRQTSSIDDLVNAFNWNNLDLPTAILNYCRELGEFYDKIGHLPINWQSNPKSPSRREITTIMRAHNNIRRKTFRLHSHLLGLDLNLKTKPTTKARRKSPLKTIKKTKSENLPNPSQGKQR